PVDPVDDALFHDGHERRHLLDAESLQQLRVLVGVDARDAQAVALLAGDVCEQALHAARRSRRCAREEDEHRQRWLPHRRRVPRTDADRNYTQPRMYELWLIGIAAGAGAAFGLAAAGAFARFDRAPLLAALVALVAGALLGWLVFDWKAAIAGGVVGALSGF